MLRKLPLSTSLSEAVRILKRFQENSERDRSIIPPEESSIRIMTVHASKGLEFEWVVVHGSSYWSGSNKNTKCILESITTPNAFEVCIPGDFHTAGFAAASSAKEQRLDDEEIRLYYVALTRAKQKLILPLYAKRAEGEDYHHEPQIVNMLGHEHVIAINDVDLPEPTRMEPTSVMERTLLAVPTDQTPVKPIKSVTAHTHKEEAFKSVGSGVDSEEALAFGSFVHEVLAAVPFDASHDDITKCCAERFKEVEDAKNFDQVQWIDKATRMVTSWLQSSFLQGLKGGTCVREYPLMHQVDEAILRGIVDFACETDAQVVIVDYKSDENVTDGVLLDRYAAQLKIYGQAVSTHSKKTVKCFIWSLTLDREIEVSLAG